jgi:hypothetical protein
MLKPQLANAVPHWVFGDDGPSHVREFVTGRRVTSQLFAIALAASVSGQSWSVPQSQSFNDVLEITVVHLGNEIEDIYRPVAEAQLRKAVNAVLLVQIRKRGITILV